MGINVGMATAFPDSPRNVMAFNGQLTDPVSYTGNQWAWYGFYHESDHVASGTLHLSDGAFAATYNNGNGVCSNCVGGHFEAVGNFYGGTNTPLSGYNAGLECNSGVKANATHTNDYCFHVLTPFTGGTFTNGHTGILLDDQSAGVISGAYGINILTGTGSGYIGLNLNANNMFVAGTSTNSMALKPPANFATNGTAYWPPTQGTIASTSCPSGAKVYLNADFTSANASGLQAITGLSCTLNNAFSAGIVPVASFVCQLVYSQATNVASDQFGVGYSGGSVTNFSAWGSVATNTGAATPFTTGAAIAIVANTPTAVVTFQPGNTGVDIAQVYGTLETAATGTLQLYVTNGTAADVIVVKRDSYCQFF
jgi:hypothetical protein